MLDAAPARRVRRIEPATLLNAWPPFVDAMVLTFAAFFLIAVSALVKQRHALSSLEASKVELERLRADKARIDGRLRALAASSALEIDDGKVILQGEVL